MIDKFYVFKNELDISYMIGPKGFNNNPDYAYSKLKIWKFYGNENLIHIITSETQIHAYFSEGDALVELLLKNNVPIEEIEIEKITYDDKLSLPHISFTNGNSFTITNDYVNVYCILKNQNGATRFDEALDNNFDHKKYQEFPFEIRLKKIVRHLLKSKLKLGSESFPDKNGNPPEWISLRRNREENSQNKDVIINIIKIILAIAIAILTYKYWN